MIEQSDTLRSRLDWWFELRCRCERGRCVQISLHRLCQDMSPDRTIASVAAILRCQHCNSRPRAIVLLKDVSLRRSPSGIRSQDQAGILIYGAVEIELEACASA